MENEKKTTKSGTTEGKKEIKPRKLKVSQMQKLMMLSKLIKYGYEKAISYSKGFDKETNFIIERKNINKEDLILEYEKIVLDIRK